MPLYSRQKVSVSETDNNFSNIAKLIKNEIEIEMQIIFERMRSMTMKKLKSLDSMSLSVLS